MNAQKKQKEALVKLERRITRGDRFVTIEVDAWSNPNKHHPETGETPLVTLDVKQAIAAEQAGKDAWLAKYGVPLPPAEEGDLP